MVLPAQRHRRCEARRARSVIAGHGAAWRMACRRSHRSGEDLQVKGDFSSAKKYTFLRRPFFACGKACAIVKSWGFLYINVGGVTYNGRVLESVKRCTFARFLVRGALGRAGRELGCPLLPRQNGRMHAAALLLDFRAGAVRLPAAIGGISCACPRAARPSSVKS